MRKKERGGGEERRGEEGRGRERDCAPRGARISLASAASARCEGSEGEKVEVERSETSPCHDG